MISLRGNSYRREAEALVKSLGCKPGASLAEITQKVAAAHRKQIVLKGIDDADLEGMTGLWIETENSSYILFRSEDPKIYQMHSIFHEFGHILANHKGCQALEFVDCEVVKSTSLGSQIQSVRARGLMEDAEEVVAEEVAYALPRLMLGGHIDPVRAVFE